MVIFNHIIRAWNCGDRVREVKSFGFTSAGDRVLEVKLKNSEGMKVSLLNYGCIIRSLEVPDKYGKSRDVVLGCDNIIAYEQQDCYLGAVVGRVANRISKAAFTLEGEKYLLTANDGENHLHGGVKGFDKYIWDISEQSESSVLFERMSEDGEEGYPGNLKVSVRYTLLENNSLVINYKAKTDKSTPACSWYRLAELSQNGCIGNSVWH